MSLLYPDPQSVGSSKSLLKEPTLSHQKIWPHYIYSASLHWLPIQARADFKVLLLTYKSLWISIALLVWYPSTLSSNKDSTIPRCRLSGGSQNPLQKTLRAGCPHIEYLFSGTNSLFKLRRLTLFRHSKLYKTFLFSQLYGCWSLCVCACMFSLKFHYKSSIVSFAWV